jgi:hypothetical protein
MSTATEVITVVAMVPILAVDVSSSVAARTSRP